MKKIFIDTNIIIDFTKGRDKLLKNLINKQKKDSLRLFINPIVVAEFFSDKNLEDKEKLKTANNFFQYFSILAIDKNTGLIVGELLRNNQVLFFADAFIAATCLQHHLLLATKNKKDFLKIKTLAFYKI